MRIWSCTRFPLTSGLYARLREIGSLGRLGLPGDDVRSFTAVQHCMSFICRELADPMSISALKTLQYRILYDMRARIEMAGGLPLDNCELRLNRCIQLLG